MKKLIEKIFDFGASDIVDEEEKTDEQWENDYNYVENYIRNNKVPTEKDVIIQFLISKYFSGEEAVNIIMRCKDIPLEKFKIDNTNFQVLSLRFRNRISDNQFQFEYINVLFDQNGRYSFLTDRPDINDISPNAESSAIYMLENDYLKRALDEVDCEFVVEECK